MNRPIAKRKKARRSDGTNTVQGRDFKPTVSIIILNVNAQNTTIRSQKL